VVEDPIDIGRHEAAPLDGSELPPVMFLADHFGYSSGISHGLTTYFLSCRRWRERVSI
jgi:hypothetical protein